MIRRIIAFFLAVTVFGSMFGGLFFLQNKTTPQNKTAVFFYYNERVYPVYRHLEPGDNALKVAMVELLRGPNDEEKKRGLFTLIPENIQIKQRVFKIFRKRN